MKLLRSIQSWSLRAQTALATALLIIMLTGALVLWVGQTFGDRLTAQIGQALAESSHQFGSRLDAAMAARMAEVEVLTTLPPLARPMENRQAVRELLNSLQNALPMFSWIGYISPGGEVLESSDNILRGADLTQRPIYRRGREGLFIGDVHDAVLLAQKLPHPDGRPIQFVDIAMPVQAPDGTLAGIVGAHLSWRWAEAVEYQMQVPMRTRRDVELYVVGVDGTVLLGSEEMRGQSLSLDALTRASGGDTGWTIEEWPDGRSYLTGYTLATGTGNYPGLGWRVLARQPVDVALAPVRALQRHALVIGILIAAGFAISGWYFAGMMTAPLRRIARAADRMRHGDEQEIPRVGGSREISSLSSSLRALVDSLRASRTALGEMETRAHLDPLTDLPNRRGMEAWLTEAGKRSRRDGTSIALILLDLDGFKPINDSLGHAAGDSVLREVGARLRQVSRGNDLVARLGGDEFVMALEISSAPQDSHVELVAERVVRRLGRPVDTGEGQATVGCSAGFAFWPHHGDTIQEVMQRADEALYEAKTAGKNRARGYHPRTAASASA